MSLSGAISKGLQIRFKAPIGIRPQLMSPAPYFSIGQSVAAKSTPMAMLNHFSRT